MLFADMLYEIIDVLKLHLKQQINAFHSSSFYEHKMVLIFQVEFREAFTATGYVELSITKLSRDRRLSFLAKQYDQAGL